MGIFIAGVNQFLHHLWRNFVPGGFVSINRNGLNIDLWDEGRSCRKNLMPRAYDSKALIYILINYCTITKMIDKDRTNQVGNRDGYNQLLPFVYRVP